MNTPAKFPLPAVWLLGALGAASCAVDVDNSTPGRAEENYLVAWNPSSCTIARTRKPVLRVCVRGSGNIAHAQMMTRRGLEAWLVPLRARYEGIATDIEFGCTNADATVNVYPGDGRAYSSPGVVQGIYDARPLGSWIHEFGHAFACLGDTYVGGTAAWCQAGQPRSIMCYGLLLNDVTADDIAGLEHQADRLGFTRRGPGDDGGTTPDASAPPPDVTAPAPDASAPPPDASAPPPDASGGGRCGGYDTCGTCAPVSGCGWCGASGTCIPVDNSGVPTAACAGGFALYARECPAPDGGEACGRYAGWSIWTCIDARTRVRCVGGSLQRETCHVECVTRPTGVDDICR